MIDPTAPISVCAGSSRPIACALTRATRILWQRDEQWKMTQDTALGYTLDNRLAKAGAIVIGGIALVILLERLS